MKRPDESGAPSPRRGRPSKADQQRTAIVQAAVELFAERSPADVSLEQISLRAGVPHASMHRIFPKKSDIVRAVVYETQARRAQRQWDAQLRGATPGQTLRMAIEDRTGARSLLNLLMAEGAAADPPDMPTLTQALGYLKSTEFGEESGFDPRIVVMLLASSATSLSVLLEPYMAALDLGDDDRDWVYDELARLMTGVMALTRSRGPEDEDGAP